MPMPEGRRLTQGISPILTNMAMSYLPGLNGFIARRVFPRVTVNVPFGLYNVLPRGDFLRPVVKKLANNEAAPIGGFKFTQDVFNTEEYGIAANWTDRDLNAAAAGGMGGAGLIRAKVLYVTMQSLLGLEMDTAALVRNAANWAGSVQGVSATPGAGQMLKWTDPASDPIGWFKDQRLASQLGSGFAFNKAIIPLTVIRHLSEHPDFIDRVKYGGNNGRPAQVDMSAIADLLGIGEIIVPGQDGGGVVNLAEEGDTDNIGWIWGNDVWLGYTPDTPSMEMPSAGYHFAWNGAQGEGPQPFQGPSNDDGLFIRRYTENRPAAYFVESRYYTVPKVTAAGLGFLFKDAV